MKGISGGSVRIFPGGDTPREQLIETLSAVFRPEQARSVVDALDCYMEEGDRGIVMGLENLTPNYAEELKRVTVERDRALSMLMKKEEPMLKTESNKTLHATDAVHRVRAIYEQANIAAVAVLQEISSEKERIAAEKMLAAIGITIHPTDADDAGELVDTPQE